MYDSFCQRREKETCEWIFAHPEFQSWDSASSSSRPGLLWIHGPAGYGKTVLCARIIEHFQQGEGATPVSHYFFSSESESRSDPFAVVRAWIYQLASSDQRAFDLARDSWDSIQGRSISPSATKELFKSIANNIPNCIFIVDGLDECAGKDSKGGSSPGELLLALFVYLEEVLPPHSRLVIVSRDDHNIQHGIYSSGNIASPWQVFDCRIQPDDVKPDAKRFAHAICNKNLDNKPEAFRDDIANQMVERFEAMFLGIRMVKDDLRRGKSERQLQKSIQRLPAELSKLYDSKWRLIMGLEEPDRSRALSILRWATYAMRPLTVVEMTEALLVADDECEGLSEDERPDAIDEHYVKSEIVELCQSLVELRGTDSELSSRTIHLTHFSVKEYILCHQHFPPGQFIDQKLHDTSQAYQHNLLAATSLRYLQIDSVWPTSNGSDATDPRDFLRYAAECWTQHVREDIDNTSLVVERVNYFFGRSCRTWERWRKYVDGMPKEEGRFQYQENIPNPSRMFHAGVLGLMATLVHLVEGLGTNVDETDVSGRTALHAASSHGWVAGVKYLLGKGADVNNPHSQGGYPLHQAALEGELDVLKMLLEAGADVTAKNSAQETALLVASRKGHTEMVGLLLDKGADINAMDGSGLTSLFQASCFGHSAVARLLIERGACKDAPDKNGFTPLFGAACGGSLETAQLLLDLGPVDLEAKTFHGLTPLSGACQNGHLEFVKWLLERGADLESQDSFSYTPLCRASEHGHVNIVKCLIQRGADIEASHSVGLTSLSYAARSGHLETVKALLENGADPLAADDLGMIALFQALLVGHDEVADVLFRESGPGLTAAKTEDGMTPLHYAAWKGKEDMTRWLLEKGADVTCKNDRGRTALSYGAQGGYTATVQLLAEVYVDIDEADATGRTTLSWAASWGSVAVIELLLEKGASLHTQDEGRRTPISWAASYNHANVIDLLISKGAEFEARDNEGCTPLWWGAKEGHSEVVQLLVDRGVDLDVPDNHGTTPLLAAIQNQQAEAAELLLQKGAKWDSTDGDGRTLLSWASQKILPSVIDLLIEKGAEMESRGNNGRTPLSWASSWNSPAVQQLLDKGADLHTKDNDGRGLLSWAAEFDHDKVTELLLERGADIEVQDNTGRTPISWACGWGKLDVVRVLAEKGANIHAPDQDGQVPVSVAAEYGHDEVVKFLMERGADIETPDSCNRTSLSNASLGGNPSTVRLLIEKGAQLQPLSKIGCTPLSHGAEVGSLEAVEILLEKGADQKIKNKWGMTPFLLAARNGRVEVVKTLLDHGADIADADVDGETAVFHAAAFGHADTIQVLVDRGGSVDAPNRSGMTPLMQTCSNAHPAVVRILLDSGVATDVQDSTYGRTALHYAVWAKCEEAVQMLLDRGASPAAGDAHSRNSFHFAAFRGHAPIFSRLLDAAGNSGGAESRDRWGATPLSIASRQARKEVVETILARIGQHVDLGSKDDFGRCLLWWSNSGDGSGNNSEVAQALHGAAEGRGVRIDSDRSPQPSHPWVDGNTRGCDVCLIAMVTSQMYLHCDVCLGGDCDMCFDCHSRGARCLGGSEHQMEERENPVK